MKKHQFLHLLLHYLTRSLYLLKHLSYNSEPIIIATFCYWISYLSIFCVLNDVCVYYFRFDYFIYSYYYYYYCDLIFASVAFYNDIIIIKIESYYYIFYITFYSHSDVDDDVDDDFDDDCEDFFDDCDEIAKRLKKMMAFSNDFAAAANSIVVAAHDCVIDYLNSKI